MNALLARTAPPVLTLQGAGGRKWRVLEPTAPASADGTHLQEESTGVPPGLYWLESARVHVPVVLPLAIAPTADRDPVEVRVDVSRVPAEVPKGMVYVPAGRPASEEDAGPAFLIGASEVTYVEYAEWIGEILEAERAERLPAQGFQPDSDFPGHYIVEREYEDRPVTGIRPERRRGVRGLAGRDRRGGSATAHGGGVATRGRIRAALPAVRALLPVDRGGEGRRDPPRPHARTSPSVSARNRPSS